MSPTAGPVNGRVSNWFVRYPSPRPPLPGTRHADVCIVGAGYTGLWTAYYLKRTDPSLRIVVLEARVRGMYLAYKAADWHEARGLKRTSPIAVVADRIAGWPH